MSKLTGLLAVSLGLFIFQTNTYADTAQSDPAVNTAVQSEQSQSSTVTTSDEPVAVDATATSDDTAVADQSTPAETVESDPTTESQPTTAEPSTVDTTESTSDEPTVAYDSQATDSSTADTTAADSTTDSQADVTADDATDSTVAQPVEDQMDQVIPLNLIPQVTQAPQRQHQIKMKSPFQESAIQPILQLNNQVTIHSSISSLELPVELPHRLFIHWLPAVKALNSSQSSGHCCPLTVGMLVKTGLIWTRNTIQSTSSNTIRRLRTGTTTRHQRNLGGAVCRRYWNCQSNLHQEWRLQKDHYLRSRLDH